MSIVKKLIISFNKLSANLLANLTSLFVPKIYNLQYCLIKCESGKVRSSSKREAKF